MVVCSNPKMCKTARPNAKTAIKRNHARLFIKPDSIEYNAQAPATVVKGLINSSDEIENFSTNARETKQVASK